VRAIVVVVVMTTVMVMAVFDDHDLRLRRIGNCEAKDKSESEQNPFHSSVSRTARKFTELL
jgi:hypothetical protein